MFFAKMSVAGAVIALAGCSGNVSKVIDDLPGGVSEAAPAVALFRGDVIAVGPTGYCVDPDSSRIKTGFAILAPCTTLGVEGAVDVTRAIATVQAGEKGSAIVEGNAEAFAAYLRGPDGPLALSRSGDADTVKVSEVQAKERHVIVYLQDKAPAFLDGAQEEEWRAFFDVAGRLLTVSVRGLDGAPLSESQGASLLEQAVKALFAANSAA